MEYPPCRCGALLWTDIERYNAICSRCIDRKINQEKRRREWDYYHPGEPMPNSENPPMTNPELEKK